jgi:hypothetical protein
MEDQASRVSYAAAKVQKAALFYKPAPMQHFRMASRSVAHRVKVYPRVETNPVSVQPAHRLHQDKK